MIRFLILILLHFGASAEDISWNWNKNDISFSMKISSSSIALDDTVQIQATLPSGTDPNQLIQALTRHVNPLHPLWSISKQNIHENHLEVELTPLSEGKLPLSFFEVKVENTSIWTPIFEIEVKPVSLAISDLQTAPLLPLAPQYAITLNEENRQNLFSAAAISREARLIQQRLYTHHFPWLFLVLVATGSLGWVIWKLVLPLYYNVEKPLQINFIDPSTEALQLLNQIRHQNLPAEQYYNAITKVVRRYVQRQYHIPVVYQTTAEFLDYLERHKEISPKFGQAVHRFFVDVDEVKFARHVPNNDESEKMYNQVVDIIKTQSIPRDFDSSSKKETWY